MDKSFPFTQFYLIQEKKISVKKLKKSPLVKWTAKYVFLIGVAIKIAVSVSWWTTPVSLC